MASNFNLVGKDYIPPDVRAKVTGRAKYADDYLFDNLLHAKTFKSPYAHARVKSIDTSAAEKMSGVRAVLTYKDVPAEPINQPALDGEPLVFGTPVAAVAAVDEYTAADAVDAIDVEWEVLDHVIDPIETLKPGSPNARSDGNIPTGKSLSEAQARQTKSNPTIDTVKWDNADFSTPYPTNAGEYTVNWSWGDVSKGLAKADHVIEDTVEAHPVVTNPMEPRSNVAYWQSNGKLRVWGSSQSVGLTYFGLAGAVGANPADVSMILNFCGGGFGSKGTNYPQMSIPALLSKEVNQPVKIRGTRREEFYWGNGRSSNVFHFKIGFSKTGRITGLDVQTVADAGAYSSNALSNISGALTALSANLQPETMRARAIGVFTNTPKRWPMRGPGQNQAALAVEPLLDRAAKELGIDSLKLRLQNVPTTGDPAGENKTPLTSAHLGEAYQMAAQAFGYDQKKSLNGKREGNLVHGIGMGSASHQSGYVGFDGLMAIHPDGTVEIRQGAGNLGTYSYSDVCRLGAETLGVPWDQVTVGWGRSDRSSFTLGQFSSNTTFTTGLSQVKAAETAVSYLQEIAANQLGGSPSDYQVANGEVSNGSGDSMTLAEAAKAAVSMGGKYTGEAIPADLKKSLNPMTLAAAGDLVGKALIAFGHSGGPDLKGFVDSFNAAMAHVTIDLGTGKIRVIDLADYGDSGTIVHPASYHAQIQGGAIQGIGYALTELMRFDEQTGIPINTDWYQNKPPSILDYTEQPLKTGGVNKPDPYGPHGAKGVGEPPYGAAASAVTAAIQNGLGATFQHHPITPSDVLDKIAAGETKVS